MTIAVRGLFVVYKNRQYFSFLSELKESRDSLKTRPMGRLCLKWKRSTLCTRKVQKYDINPILEPVVVTRRAVNVRLNWTFVDFV